MSRKKLKSFEEMHGEIDAAISRCHSRWKLKAISWMDFDDVKQIIKLHVYNKWKMWDQSRPIGPWINSLASNQIRNILRNVYVSYIKPCASCPFNQNKSLLDHSQDQSCGFTPSKTQCSECPLYAKWEKTKKNAYDLKIPVALENHKNYHSSLVDDAPIDLLAGESRLHFLMKEKLSDRHFFIYKMFFIDCLTDEQVAKFLNFRTSEKGRKAGYKQIKNLKRLLYLTAKDLLKSNDIFSNE